MATSARRRAVRTSGVFSSVRAISGVQPGLDDHLGKRLGAPQPLHHDRQPRPRCEPLPTSTTWPGAARIPVKSATAGGTDSAEKKDS